MLQDIIEADRVSGSGWIEQKIRAEAAKRGIVIDPERLRAFKHRNKATHPVKEDYDKSRELLEKCFETRVFSG